MNQYSQYLMWVKNKYIRNSHFRASMINPFNNSWEERAFADDASGALGGFVWPPRSYSCSFCKREFRSAQALGGHMNIHRKDRARLKQSLTPQTEGFHHQNQNHKHHHDYKSLGDHHSYPSQERLMELRRYSSPASRSDSKGFGLFNVSDFKSASEVRKEGTFAFPGGQNENCVETSLSMGLDLADSQNRPYGSDFDEVILTSKRHKTTVSSVPFFLEQCSKDRYSLEKLDLELRLGDPPKVK